ncbi:MAG: hypothetical protein PVSMB8_00010 [Vulcanimicrobiaceae bacterium]
MQGHDHLAEKARMRKLRNAERDGRLPATPPRDVVERAIESLAKGVAYVCRVSGDDRVLVDHVEPLCTAGLPIHEDEHELAITALSGEVGSRVFTGSVDGRAVRVTEWWLRRHALVDKEGA